MKNVSQVSFMFWLKIKTNNLIVGLTPVICMAAITLINNLITFTA